MAAPARRSGFLETETGQEIHRLLQRMTADTGYHTPSSYSANTGLHPDNRISFTEKHLDYLIAHPKIDPQTYVANLRLMTRARR